MRKITVVGSINADYVFNVGHTPVPGETLLASGFSVYPGGKGANQAYALARMGAAVTLLGAVGTDANGDMELASLAGAGVDVSNILRAEDQPTGMTSIYISPEGDNTIVVAQNANLHVTREYIDANASVLEQSDVVVLQLEIPLETVMYVAKTAKAMGKTVILDPAPAVGRLPGDLLACIDVVKPNEGELAELTGLGVSELEHSCRLLLEQGVGRVLATLGGKGSALAEPGEALRFFPPKPVTAVDTTAAGDSFLAAIAYGLVEGMAMERAVRFATEVSGVVVTRKGAQSSIPTAEEIQALLLNSQCTIHNAQ